MTTKVGRLSIEWDALKRPRQRKGNYIMEKTVRMTIKQGQKPTKEQIARLEKLKDA